MKPPGTPTVEQTFSPVPLSDENKLDNTQNVWENEINPTLQALTQATALHPDAQQYVEFLRAKHKQPGYSPDDLHFIASPDSQQAIAQALSPLQTAHSMANSAFKQGLKLYAIANPVQTSLLIGSLYQASPIAGLAVTAGLFVADPLVGHLRQLENQYQSWTSPTQKINFAVSNKLRQTALQGIMPTLTKGVDTFGYMTGLYKSTLTPSQFDPSVMVETPVNRLSSWLHLTPAHKFEHWATHGKISTLDKLIPKGTTKLSKFTKPALELPSKLASNLLSRDSVKTGLLRHSQKLKSRKRRSLLEWLLYPVVLAGGLTLEIFFSYLTAKIPQLAPFVHGVAGPMIKGLPSINTGLGAWGGYKLGNSLGFGKFGSAVTSTGLGGLGWYYQTLTNMANNYTTVNASIFQSTGLASSMDTRISIMPEAYAKTYGPQYYNNPQAINQYINEFGSYEFGSEYLGDATQPQYRLLNARHLPQKGVLGKIFGKPAQFLFKHRFVNALIPFRGLMLNLALDIPVNSWPFWAILGGDIGIKLLSLNEAVVKVRNAALWGGVLGAELAIYSGLNPWVGGAIGSTIGAGLRGFSMLSTWSVPALPVGNQNFFNPGLVDINSKFNQTFARPNPNLIPRVNFMDLANKGDFLTWRLSKTPIIGRLSQTKLFQNFSNRLNRLPAMGEKMLRFRFLRGAGTGAWLGAQIALLTGFNPYLGTALGAGAGIGAQIFYEKVLAKAFAKFSGLMSKFARGIGTALRPIFAVANVGAAMSSFSSFLSQPNWGNLGKFAGLSALATYGLTLAGLTLPVSLLIVGAAALIEGITYLITGTSIIGSITSALGRVLGPLLQGVAGFLGQVASAGIGFLMGIYQVATSTDIQKTISGAVTAAFSIATIGTGLLATIAASGFFSGVPAASRRLARGMLHFDVNKKILSSTPNSAEYQITYAYTSPLTDQNGQPISGPAANITITDQFVSPPGLKRNDIQLTTIDPSSTITSLSGSPPQIKLKGFNSLQVGQSDQVAFNLIFTRPLADLLSQYNATAICNQATFTAHTAGANPTSVSPTVCLDADGNLTSPPSDLTATNLAQFLLECYQQSCDPAVTSKDFVIPEDYDPENPSCVDPDEIIACEQLYMAHYGINNNILDILSQNTQDPNNTNHTLQPLGFIQAAEALQGRTFPIFENPQDYQTTCLPNNYVYYPTTSYTQFQPGDIIVHQNAGPFAIYLEPGVGSNILVVETTTMGNPLISHPVVPGAVEGYIRYEPDTCP